MMRSVAIAVSLCFVPVVAGAWVPGSGDVDRDGRTTTRDAVLILESKGWPERDRATLRGWKDACDVNSDGVCDDADAYQVFMSAITNWDDYDSDGVPNALDCAPFDERIAAPHTYFADKDFDHIGASDQPVTVCTATPEAPLVAWGGDTNDYTPWELPLPILKADRLLSVDVGAMGEAGLWRSDLAKELGVDATPLQINWNLIETAPGLFDGPQIAALSIAASEFERLHLKVALSVNPISQGRLTLPPDLQADLERGRARFSDVRVIDRYKAMLTAVHALIPGLQLTSLQIGYEVDRFLGLPNVPAYFWADYGALVIAASEHAHALWGPVLQIGVTATHSGLLASATRAQMSAINHLVDIVSATYAPVSPGIAGFDPTLAFGDVQRLVALSYPQPLHIQSVEYPSAPAAGGSETRQSQFIRAIFDAWDQYRAFIPYVGFGRLHDRSPIGAITDEASIGGVPHAGSIQLGSVGLRLWSGAGRGKIAYDTLRNLAFERGWWRLESSETRSFHMGFSQALFDAPSDPASYVSMLDWIRDAASQNGTFYNLHLDNGVPWLEAYADDLSWPLLPYSPQLRQTWDAYRSRIPVGQKLLVSVNPTGVPRNVIAPYFGLGEGFIYSPTFERVGDGIIADGENRLPPPPWNTYQFDDPAVKQAFTNYCRRVIDYFSPDYLVIAIETTATMNEDPNAHARLVALVRHVREQLAARSETRKVKIMVSLSATSFMVDEFGSPLKREEQGPRKRDLQIQGLSDMAPYVDGFSLSFYPHYSKWNASFMLASMFDELWKVLAEVGKPTGFSESGWPAESFDVAGSPFFSDADKQARYVRLLLTEADRAPVPVDFVVNFRTRDGDLQWQRLLEWSQEQPPKVSPQFVEFYKYFRDIGIFDGDGQPRPATQVWRDHLMRTYKPRERP